jgi:hypothetical protein
MVVQENTERWKLLCEQAATEQDSTKLFELLREINKLLEEKYNRVRMNNTTPENK